MQIVLESDPDVHPRCTPRSALPWRVSLAGLGAALPGVDLPGVVVDNDALAASMREVCERTRRAGSTREVAPTSVEFPWERAGIRTRHILDRAFGARHLARVAGRAALEDSGLDPRRVRAVIVSTVSAERAAPAVATDVAAHLELEPGVLAFDLSLGCNGFVAALEVAQGLLATAAVGDGVLVVAAEAMSRVLDAGCRETLPIFGDGAGAALVRREAGARACPTRSRTVGRAGDNIVIDEDRGAHPLFRLSAQEGRAVVLRESGSRRRVAMRGRRVFRDMVRALPAALADFIRARPRCFPASCTASSRTRADCPSTRSTLQARRAHPCTCAA